MPTTDALDHLIDAARATHSSALVLLHDGVPLVNESFDGPARPIEAMSVTKAIVSLLVGRAVTLGHLESVDVNVSEFYLEWRQGRKRHITLRHLLNHTSGLQNEPLTTAELYPSDDFIQLALCAELSDEPGARLAYNNKAYNLLAGVLHRATGRRMDDFARAELLAPLGITDFSWATDRAGNPQCMAGFAVRPLDLAHLGHLLITRGLWDGQRLVDDSWFDLSLNPTTPAWPTIGLGWWFVGEWEKRVVALKHVEAWRAAGIPEEDVRALEGLLGEHEREAIASTFQAALGAQWIKKLDERPDAFDFRVGPPKVYYHDGHLGQCLAVLPSSGLVAVRMLDWQSPYAREAGSAFPDFLSLVGTLEEVYSKE
ncbi:serine hydrolase domain-containing protein [Deinococcus soli (ex Cha et al. 2016)]|uniref:serine hydrolase domain-containing protein n=1 Tax=Deinococcus soli (ex Cha et al. 2016) TaxID=1309411 RepID=UPI0016661ABF|nr:serine hydrolase domain-containing protein [Deinococcus soli (ex Cha et al. 2016)]GGB76407.1 hypothetical protein GCM10008019_35760 [Deinococcus soli (ex Cha et al. 2016)]